MKRCLVFGASGSIGREVSARLHRDGHIVIVCSKGINPTLIGSMMDSVWNVADRKEMQNYADVFKKRDRVDAIVYAVGHCPPNGFAEAIRYPLSQLPLENLTREINMHQVGVLNVFQLMLEHLNDGGCFVFLSSAITRLKGQFPPFLQAYHYASAISAEDWLIDGMRFDPTVKQRGIRIHRLAPVAVDTPFFGEHKPPEIIPISRVVDEVVDVLDSQKNVDKQII